MTSSLKKAIDVICKVEVADLVEVFTASERVDNEKVKNEENWLEEPKVNLIKNGIRKRAAFFTAKTKKQSQKI